MPNSPIPHWSFPSFTSTFTYTSTFTPVSLRASASERGNLLLDTGSGHALSEGNQDKGKGG